MAECLGLEGGRGLDLWGGGFIAEARSRPRDSDICGLNKNEVSHLGNLLNWNLQ